MERTPIELRSVLAIPSDGGAVGSLRLLNPLTYVARSGVRCVATARAGSLDELVAADVVVVQRQHDPALLAWLVEARARGTTTIYEIDDDLLGLTPDNPVYQLYPPGSPQREGVAAMVRAVSGVTVSTDELAERYRPLNPNVRVLPNCIDFGLRDWATRPDRESDGRIVIGWAGSATHVPDLELVRRAVRDVLREEPRAWFAVLSTPGITDWIRRDWNLPKGRLVAIPYRDHHAYPGALPLFDVGLAPLVDTPFNRSKSNIKLLEYGAWGIPAVASPVGPYAATIADGVNGCLATTGADWHERLLGLVRDPSLRATLGQAMRRLVEERFDLAREWPRWPRAWAEIADAGRH